MGRTITAVAFLLLFGAVAYLGAMVRSQQNAIEALIFDHNESVKLQHKLSIDIQQLRRQLPPEK
jgi:hypothetical protein